MERPEELDDPKLFDEIMEDINTKLAVSAIPLRERGQMALVLLSNELEGNEMDYDVADDDSVYPQVMEWYRQRFPGERI